MHHDHTSRLSHGHDFLGASHESHARRTRWVVGLTAIMMVIEIAAGLWTGARARHSRSGWDRR